MKNVTLAIPDELLEKSRAYAQKHGTSLNEFIRELLRRYVMKEFAAVMISKYQVDPRKVKKIITDLSGFEVVQIDVDLIQKAIDTHILFQYSFWHSLIISAAQAANCSVLLTEDLQHQPTISGLTIYNPFAP